MRSKRYIEIEKLFNKSDFYSLEEALEIISKYGDNIFKQVILSVSLNKNKNKKLTFKSFLRIPHVVKCPNIAIISDKISPSIKSSFLNKALFIEVDELEKIIVQRNKKKWGFDKLFADSSVLSKIGKFSRKLSSKKCFPNLKDGTVYKSEVDIKDYLEGKAEIKSDKFGNFQFLIGKNDFSNEMLKENYLSVLNKITSLKPSNWKGEYLKNVTLSTVMGPSVKIKI